MKDSTTILARTAVIVAVSHTYRHIVVRVEKTVHRICQHRSTKEVLLFYLSRTLANG